MAESLPAPPPAPAAFTTCFDCGVVLVEGEEKYCDQCEPCTVCGQRRCDSPRCNYDDEDRYE